MKRKAILEAMLTLLIFWALIGFARGYTDSPACLWTTDVNGLAEVNEFSSGDPVYLKTADTYPGVNYPLQPGTYCIYLFEGNIFTSSGALPVHNGMPIVNGRTPLGLTPMNVTTDSNGRFGPVVGSNPGWATPIKIWEHATAGNFSIVLDKIRDQNGNLVPGIGTWQDGRDYRDDLGISVPTPPSFHVVPKVGPVPEFPIGLVFEIAFIPLICYMWRKRKT